MNYKEVNLLSIGKVRVYRPPNMKIHRMVSAKYKYPPQPVKRVEAATPKGMPQLYEDVGQNTGPEYDAWKAECDSIDEMRYAEINEANLLYALQKVQVPDDFDVDAEYGDFARMLDESWEPRAGVRGRRLDYLEWVVCGTSNDNDVVSDALSELIGISQEVVDDVKDSFPGDVEGGEA